MICFKLIDVIDPLDTRLFRRVFIDGSLAHGAPISTEGQSTCLANSIRGKGMDHHDTCTVHVPNCSDERSDRLWSGNYRLSLTVGVPRLSKIRPDRQYVCHAGVVIDISFIHPSHRYILFHKICGKW
jgi:hypothetical protein